jgi:para-nitrobenzyl esterase
MIGTAAMLLAGGDAAQAGRPVVRTAQGSVRGIETDGVALFAGMPFAAPPIGARRWRAPGPAQSWRGTRSAARFGPDCPQPRRDGRSGGPQSEDCLTLTVATPSTKARNLPVLVSIHGGAYFAGSGRETFSRGMPAIVKDGVVLVAPNYRLGRLGFFAHPALTSEAPDATANYWLMDQVAALRWVRANIARFGGDPANVTIIGCSAGGSSVNALLATPAARGLFARASAHSAGGLFNANRGLAEGEAQGLGFAARVNAAGQGPDALVRLRQMSATQLLAGDSGPPDFGAIVDGRWLTAPLSVAFARGNAAHVPLITGSTSNEASVFGLMGFDKTVLARRFGIHLDAIAPAYGVADSVELIRQVQTDFIFTAAAMGMTALAARAGNPAWSYHFDYVDKARRGSVPGAAHCEDTPYWLGQQHGVADEDAAIGRTMRAYLLNFVRNGDPNGPGLPRWEGSPAGAVNPLLINSGTGMAPGFRARQLAPWYAKWEAETGLSLGLAAKPARAR